MKPFKIYVNTSLTFCLLFMVITLSGCWDYKDINHRVLPVALGISTVDSQYEVFLKIPMTEENKINMKIFSAKGETISKAVDTISRNLESSVDLLHVKIILIERRTAEEGMKDIIAGFIRSRDVPNKALVAICDEDVKEFFSKTINGTNTYDFFEKNAGWDPEIALTRVWEVYRSIHSYTRDVAIPLIISGKSTAIEQVGSAVIRNGKMVEQISSDETLLFNAFKGESASGEVEVMNHATVMILSNTMLNKSKMKDKQPYIQSQINLKVVIMETRGDPSSKLIKKELNTSLTNRFNQMFSKIQKSEADILGLGQFFRNKITRKELKNWRSDYFSNLKMDIQFHIDIQNEGFLRTT
ncbi:Ger(x)C family spore germination protein [Neobacillus niacini]|uniref:Ger(x)C family spore germination protein n=1 Tax=Neobacillus niacini TaxID=86668 RepID=UPI002FFE28FB